MKIVNIRFNGNSTFSYMTEDQINSAAKNGWLRNDLIVDDMFCMIVLIKHD